MLALGTLLLAALSATCNSRLERESPAHSARDLEPEAYEVYAVVLKWRFGKAGVERVVIQQETEVWPAHEGCLPHGDRLSSVFGDVLQSYKNVNSSPRLITKKIPSQLPYQLMQKAEIEALFSANGAGWKRFYELHPNSAGLTTFSAVGFNARKTKAIVALDHGCGSLCGGGRYYVLEKTQGEWWHTDIDYQSCEWMY